MRGQERDLVQKVAMMKNKTKQTKTNIPLSTEIYKQRLEWLIIIMKIQKCQQQEKLSFNSYLSRGESDNKNKLGNLLGFMMIYQPDFNVKADILDYGLERDAINRDSCPTL